MHQFTMSSATLCSSVAWRPQVTTPRRRRAVARPPCSASSRLDAPVNDLDPEQDLKQQKREWAASLRTMMGRRKHREWEPAPLTNPPPLLADVCVVLVSPKKPISVGTVARACSGFECLDLRIVEPRCDHLARSSRNGSKGAQFLLWQAQLHGSLESALADAALSVACTRWVAGRQHAFRSIAEILEDPHMAEMLAGGGSDGSSSSSGGGGGGTAQQQEPNHQRRKLALVFGREVEGLTVEEVEACDATLSIPIGRLQESLSLSHAVSIVLSRVFEARQAASGFALPQGLHNLAPGFQETGVER